MAIITPSMSTPHPLKIVDRISISFRVELFIAEVCCLISIGIIRKNKNYNLFLIQSTNKNGFKDFPPTGFAIISQKLSHFRPHFVTYCRIVSHHVAFIYYLAYVGGY